MGQLEILLRNGADVNTKDEKGFSLLMSCAKNNDIESIYVLLSYNVSLNSKDFFSFTALDYAIKENHLDVVKLLVNSGAIITDDSYMLAIGKNLKDIVSFFDTLDNDKQIFLKKEENR
ncbi:MAG: ankyrin repeat domain-containing protein [Campylobacterota bacterium]|nr:ankyrin repeat domain-containing protein [Campylobacterota bacterium]